jgi:hypothetical protein
LGGGGEVGLWKAVLSADMSLLKKKPEVGNFILKYIQVSLMEKSPTHILQSTEKYSTVVQERKYLNVRR